MFQPKMHGESLVCLGTESNAFEKSENVTSVGLDLFLDDALSMSYKEVLLTVPQVFIITGVVHVILT